MSGLDVDGFIASQRAKLVEEKSRMERNDRRFRGILPSDSVALERTGKLRQERQSEYQEFLKTEQKQPSNKRPAPGSSLAEIRRNMSRERERELVHNEEVLGQRKEREREPRRSDYAQLRERKLAEERRYRGNMHDQPIDNHRRKNLDDDNNRNSSLRHSDRRDTRRLNWDEEEDDLMQWTRDQAKPTTHHRGPHQRNRAETPPTFDSPRPYREASKSSLRSISAPNVSGTAIGIAALGAHDDARVRKLKQQKYAEELRRQIREKASDGGGGGGRQRESAWGKAEDKENTDGLHSYKSSDHRGHGKEAIHRTRDVEKTKRNRQLSPHQVSSSRHHSQFSRDDTPSPHHRPRYASDDDSDNRTHRKYSPPRRGDQNRLRERYDDHQRDPYANPLPPPPRPPRFHDHRGWGAPYYPYPPPPNEAGYIHDPYYYPAYHPGAAAHGYAPPPHRPHPSDKAYWEDADRRGYEPTTKNRNDSPPPPRKQSAKESKVSPLLGLGSSTESKTDKSAYRKELDRQIRDKKDRDVQEKLAKENYDKQKNTEIYDPFGKGGCGAPVRDQHGNLVADLKQMRKINENRLSNSSPLGQLRQSDGLQSPADHESPQTILTYDKMDDKKATQESYRDYLQRQVKEKEAIKQMEKERQKYEEQKELEQLEKDRKRLQEDYERELERQKKKEEDARKRNEAIKREAEIKRQMVIMQREEEVLKDEEEWRALAEKRLDENIANATDSVHRQSNSPPIPSLRHKGQQLSNPPPLRTPDPHSMAPDHATIRPSFRTTSPPVPTLRKKLSGFKEKSTERTVESVQPREKTVNVESAPPIRDPALYRSSQEFSTEQDSASTIRTRGLQGDYDADELPSGHPPKRPVSSESEQQAKLLTQLGAIRMHLQAELAKQTSQPYDIFEKAKKRKPKIPTPMVPRPNNSSSMSGLNEFTKLKYSDISKRGKFLEEFPEVPASESALELQQRALLMHQQDLLRKAQTNNNARLRGRGRKTEPRLDSLSLSTHTAQVAMDSRNPFSDDISGLSIGDMSLGDLPQRTRAPRNMQGRVSSTGSRLSVNTVDVENMAASNEERLRRLEAILSAGSSKQNATDNYSMDGDYYFSPGPRAAPPPVQVRTTHSRQSEKSLDCETQHLPA